jgi:hypothetical protein
MLDDLLNVCSKYLSDYKHKKFVLYRMTDIKSRCIGTYNISEVALAKLRMSEYIEEEKRTKPYVNFVWEKKTNRLICTADSDEIFVLLLALVQPCKFENPV